MSDTATGKGAAWLYTVACLAATAAMAVVVAKAEKVTDQMAMLPATPEVNQFLSISRRYNNFNTVLIGVETGNILASQNLTRLRDLTEAVSKVVGVSSVTSITNVLDMRTSEEGVNVAPLIPEIPRDAAAEAALKAQILKSRQIVGEMVSRDFTSALVVVMMYPDKTAEAYPVIEKIARQAAGPGMQVFFEGAPAVEQFLARGGESLTTVGIIAGIVFILMLGMGLRPFRRIPGWLMVVAPAAAGGMAVPVLVGYPFGELSMASGLAAFVFGTMAVFSYPGLPESTDDEKRVRTWRLALFFGGLALAAVFLSLVKSSVVPLRAMGVGAAASVILVALLTPPAVRFGLILAGAGLPADAAPQGAPRARGVWLVAVVPVVFAAFIVVSSPRPAAQNDLSEMFDADSEPLRTTRFLDTRFEGSDYLTIIADGDFSHPGFLRALDELCVAVRAVPGVAGVTSPTDIFKMINEAMIGQYRIPDTVGQMQSLWFFLEGQAELAALIYQREQGTVQIRLSPEWAKKAPGVMDAIRGLMRAVPARVGHVDLRLAAEGDAARLRGRQLERAEHELNAILGPAAQGRIRETLGSVIPLELGPASKTPDARVQAAFRERLATAVGTAFTAYLTGPSAPMAATQEQAGELARTLLRTDGPAVEQGRAAVDRLLQAWFPGDEQAMTKMSNALQDKARDVQDRVLIGVLVEELKVAGVAGADRVAATPELVAALRDFTSPYVFIDTAKDQAKTESVTEGRYGLSGYPVIAPIVARETYADLSRAGLIAVLAAAALAVLGFVAGRKGAGAATLLAAFAALSGLAWQVAWLWSHTWALNVSSFIPLTVVLCAATGAWLVAVGGRRVRDLAWGVLVTAAPLLVMALSGFAPVRNIMGMCGLGIAGAALAVWLTGDNVRHTYIEGREDRR